MNAKTKSLILALVLVLLLGGAAPAMAADMVDIDLPTQVQIVHKDDVTAGIFARIFGQAWSDISGVAYGGGTGQFSGLILAILGSMNIVALTLISISAFYTFGIFAVNSADSKDGSIGGGKFSSFWTPVRIAFSYSLAVPVLGGLSLLQVGLIGAVSISINMANVVWDAAATHVSSQLEAPVTDSAPPFVDSEASQAVQPLFQAVLLQETMKRYGTEIYPNTQTRDAEGGLYGTSIGIQGDWIIEHSPMRGRLILYPRAGQGMGLGSLGGISIPAPRRSKGEVLQEPEVYDSALRVAFARAKAFATMGEALRVHAKGYIAAYDPAVGQEQEFRGKPGLEIVDDYRKTVVNAVIPEIEASAARRSAVDRRFANAMGITGGHAAGGWATAGVLVPILSVASEKEDLVNYAGGVSFILIDDPMPGIQNVRDTDSLWASFVKSVGLRGSYKLSQEEITMLEKAPRYAAQTLLQGRVFTGHDEHGDPAGTLNQAVTKIFYGGSWDNRGLLAATMERFQKQNPLAGIVEFGMGCIETGMYILGASTAAGVAGVIPHPATQAFNTIVNNPATTTLMYALLGVGLVFALAFAIPVYIWIKALTAWMINVIESFFAAPIWSLAHAFPEGAGFAGNHARKGYLLILEVLIRPTLLVLCLAGALILTQGVGWMIDSVYAKFVVSMGSYVEINFWRQFFWTILYVALKFSAFIFIFTQMLIRVPPAVMTFIGGVAMSLGSTEQQVGDTTNLIAGSLNKTAMAGGGLGEHVGGMKLPEKKKDPDKDNGGLPSLPANMAPKE